MTQATAPRDWFLYLLRCADDTLYTGVTTDVARRLSEHNAGRGARYTSGRRPVILIGAWAFRDQSSVQQAEAEFRRLSRRQKLQRAARQMPVAGSPFHEDEVVSRRLAPIRFCPGCGGLLKTTERPEDHRRRDVCTICERVVYRNAKPCAGVLVTQDGQLLLVKRSIEPYLGYWDIPGGFLEEDELPDEGALREVEEETGLQVEVTSLLGFYLGRYTYADRVGRTLNTYFLGRVTGGSEEPGDDAAELAWFRPDGLPEAIAFDHARLVVEHWRQWVLGDRASSRALRRNLETNK